MRTFVAGLNILGFRYLLGIDLAASVSHERVAGNNLAQLLAANRAEHNQAAVNGDTGC